jgi:hypothetical protein
LRTAFVILLYVLFSYLVNRDARAHGKKARVTTLGSVPRGKTIFKIKDGFTYALQDSSMHECPRSQRK